MIFTLRFQAFQDARKLFLPVWRKCFSFEFTDFLRIGLGHEQNTL